MRLPKYDEPLVTSGESIEIDDHATRQMRRRARRAEAKAERGRRPAKAPVAVANAREDAVAVTTVEAPIEMSIEASVAVPVQLSPPPSEDVPAPLPSNRALVMRPARLLERLFGGWLLRRPGNIARSDPDALTEQMLVLRTELALVQSRLDRIIAATGSG